jgi:hypothetical protein
MRAFCARCSTAASRLAVGNRLNLSVLPGTVRTLATTASNSIPNPSIPKANRGRPKKATLSKETGSSMTGPALSKAGGAHVMTTVSLYPEAGSGINAEVQKAGRGRPRKVTPAEESTNIMIGSGSQSGAIPSTDDSTTPKRARGRPKKTSTLEGETGLLVDSTPLLAPQMTPRKAAETGSKKTNVKSTPLKSPEWAGDRILNAMKQHTDTNVVDKPAAPHWFDERLFNHDVNPIQAMKDYVGTGILEYAGGDVYEGEFVNGLKDGQGTIKYVNGEKFVGTFKKGRIWSGEGYFRWENGDTYTGSWENGVMHGKGRLTNAATGEVLTGEFREGKIFEGTGSLVMNEAAGAVMTGTWVRGEFTSPARESWVHTRRPPPVGKSDYHHATYTVGNATLTGVWVDGKLQGEGKGDYDTGDTQGESYRGHYKDSKRHGKGTLWSPNGLDVHGYAKGRENPYAPTFSKALEAVEASGGMDALGIEDRQRLRSQARRQNTSYRYVGDWVNGRREGHGEVRYRGGGLYVGGFKADQRHGMGVLTYPDGATLVGQFKDDDIYNGVGRFCTSTRSEAFLQYEGHFVEGHLVGPG